MKGKTLVLVTLVLGVASLFVEQLPSKSSYLIFLTNVIDWLIVAFLTLEVVLEVFGPPTS